MKMHHAAWFLAWGVAAAAAAATPQDFRSGIELLPESGHSVGELSLPDAVYQGVIRDDLGDLAVFNAGGTPVPHALCAPPVAKAARLADLPLPVFPLQTATVNGAGGAHVELSRVGAVTVEMTPGGAPATVVPGDVATAVGAYVIDARAAKGALEAIRVRWRAPDGASELHVRIDDSDDLEQWQPLVTQATLVQADAAGQTLQRERIPLPLASRSYLRITRSDPGPSPQLDEVLGELHAPEVQQSAAIWFSPARLPPGTGGGFTFDAARLAPVATARIVLPATNMTLQLSLQSRGRQDESWRTVWSGSAYTVGAGDEERHSEDARFAPDGDRYWRIEALRGAESLGTAAPQLRLGFEPARLRFLLQGDGPFLLAYGSARAGGASSASCDGLVEGLPQSELQSLIGAVQLGAVRTLGGDAALMSLPQPRPVRPMILWAVLIVGAAAVAWMALSLIRSLRR
jgi:hypothetical protein